METYVNFSEDCATLTAILSGEIDHHVAKMEKESIDSMLYRKKPDTLVLDFSSVRFMDSSGIGLIIGRVDVAEGLSCRVRVRGLSPVLKKLVKLSGVEKLKNLTLED